MAKALQGSTKINLSDTDSRDALQGHKSKSSRVKPAQEEQQVLVNNFRVGKVERKKRKEGNKTKDKNRWTLKKRETNKSRDNVGEAQGGSRINECIKEVRDYTDDHLADDEMSTQSKDSNASKTRGATESKGDPSNVNRSNDGKKTRRIDNLLLKARKSLDKRLSNPDKEPLRSRRSDQEQQGSGHYSTPEATAGPQRRKSMVTVPSFMVVEAWGSPVPRLDHMGATDPLFRRRSLDSLHDSKDSTEVLPQQERLGSANSLDQTMTRSLGSRGSLCDEAADECDNINVVIRCRPLNDKERQRGDENNLIFPGEGQAWVNMDGMNGQLTQKPKVFTYNVVFEPEALQEDILEHSGVKRLLDMAIDGFSCTIFCYGQTGSGKTHTLTGPPHLFDKGPDMFSESHGLIFRSFVYLFNQLQNRDDQEFTLTASYLEIYNEKVIDLLNIGTNTKPLQVRWSKKKRGFFVENLFEIECAELDDLLAVLEEGLRNRAVASHNMNEYSSRSHTILTVNITSEQKADDGVNLTRNGKINFVDLAGSEMTKKTNSEGKTLEEANNINKSLMVLGTCIAALSDNRKRDGHIPYRDSKLTKLLADSLAGNGVTLMIACVSPAKSNISETINTLRYATRAKRIRTKPIIVMDPKEKVIMSLQREVSLLREENAHLKMLIDLGENGLPQNGQTVVNGQLLPVMNGIDTAELVSDAGGIRVPPPMSRQGSFRIDDEKLENLDNRELIKLVQHYMAEHENVRKENKELQRVTTALVRDQELVCKENERLLRKLEDVSRDPHSNPNAQSEDRSRSLPSSSSSQVWINPLNNSRGKDSDSGPSSRGRGAGTSRESSQRHHRLPDSINKELEKRRIGKSMTDLTTSGGSSGGRRNSWDERNESEVQRMRKIPVKSKSMSPGVATGRSGGRGKTRSKSVPRLKGGGRGGIPRGPAARDTDHRPPGMRSS